MKNKWKILIGLTAFALIAMGAKLTIDNIASIGDTNSATDKVLKMGDGQLKWDGGASVLQFSNDAGGSFKDIGSGAGGGGGINTLDNPGFEDGTASWTASGGAFAVTTNPGDLGNEIQSGDWDPNGLNQTLDSDLVTHQGQLQGNNCVAEFNYKDGDSGYEFRVLDESANILASTADSPALAVQAATLYDVRVLTFPCPTSGQIKASIKSTNADGAQIFLDDIFVGKNDRFSEISQAELTAHAHYNAVANCLWERDSGSFGDFGTDADCTAIVVDSSTQTVDTTDDDLPNIVFPILKPGKYLVQVDATLFHGGSNAIAGLRIVSSTGTIGPHCKIQLSSIIAKTMVTCTLSESITTAQAVTYKLNGIENAPGALVIRNDDAGGVDGFNTVFHVTRYPLANQQAFTPDVMAWNGEWNIGGENPTLTGASFATYTEMGSGGALDLVVRPGSLPGKILCNSTNPATGLTCAAGVEHIGVQFIVPRAGKIEVCMAFTHRIGTNTAGQIETTFQIVRRDNNDASVQIEEGGGRTEHGWVRNTLANDQLSALRVCGQFVIPNSGAHSFGLFFEQFATATVETNSIMADRNGDRGQRDIHITARPIDQNYPMPQIVNTVQTPANNMRIISLRVTFPAGVPTAAEESGSFVDGALVDNGTGNTTINILAGTFASKPFGCYCSIPATSEEFTCKFPVVSASAVNIITEAPGGADTDRDVNVMCMGPYTTP